MEDQQAVQENLEYRMPLRVAILIVLVSLVVILAGFWCYTRLIGG
ncbi:MAG: hypothetical protein ACM3NH_01850 [Candidatus Saccharibacteria bacterium]